MINKVEILRSSSEQYGDGDLHMPYNGICLGKVRAFKVTQFSDSSKDDERKKAQKATKPAFGLGNVIASALFFLD